MFSRASEKKLAFDVVTLTKSIFFRGIMFKVIMIKMKLLKMLDHKMHFHTDYEQY